MESRTINLNTSDGPVVLKNIYSWDASRNYIYFRQRNPWRRYFYIMATRELVTIEIPWEDQWGHEPSTTG